MNSRTRGQASERDLASCDIALKEWAIVCDAIRRGKQLLLFRTGGIEEASGGFELLHRNFWLFPTRFHQTEGLVRQDVLGESKITETDDIGMIPIRDLCRVHSIFQIIDSRKLGQFAAWHILADEVLQERFEYRTPGLFLIVLRAFQSRDIHWITPKASYDGCRSWVELEQQLSLDDLVPVISDEEFERNLNSIENILTKA